ncbi:hypothetical protein ES705_20900 [subsurface metagenome]
MPVELQALITAGYNDGAEAGAHLVLARNNLYYAGDAIAAQNWADAKTKLYAAGDEFGYVYRYLLQGPSFYQGLREDWKDALEWINNNWPNGNGVTMDAILNAMLVADFDELQKFVGLVDAYRVAIWNAPFNANFYAALARGFQQWP